MSARVELPERITAARMSVENLWQIRKMVEGKGVPINETDRAGIPHRQADVNTQILKGYLLQNKETGTSQL